MRVNKPFDYPGPLPQLRQDEIHLWCCEDTGVNDNSLLLHYDNWLNAAERVRLRRFYFARHRHQFLITRALVRFALSCYQPCLGPAAWCFDNNDYGRPSIANEEMVESCLEFNVSHATGLVVLAVCQGGELGVDVESHQRETDATLLADRFFSPREAQALQLLPETQRRSRFFDLWTLKESYIKGRGMGLAIPLDSFSFDLSLPGNIGFSVEPEAGDRPDGWQFWQVRPNTTHQIAVAHRLVTQTPRMALKYFEVVPDASIEPVDYPVFRASARAGRLNPL